MIGSMVHELQNPSISGLCCGKTFVAGSIALALLGYAFIGAPMLGSLILGDSLKQSVELALAGLSSLVISGSVGLWSSFFLEFCTPLKWKPKALIAGGLAVTSHLSNPVWLQAPLLSLSISKIYAANGVGIGVGAAALLLQEAGACLFKGFKDWVNTNDSSDNKEALMGNDWCLKGSINHEIVMPPYEVLKTCSGSN